MKVKRYEGTTIQEIVSRIKLDLGPEASILFVKEIKQKRFLRRPLKKIEVIAGVEEENPVFDKAKLEMIHYELKELKDKLNGMQVPSSHPFVAPQENLPPVIKDIKKRLCDAEVEDDIVERIIKDFHVKYTEKELSSLALVEENLIKQIARYLDTAGPIVAENNTIVAFVGPTGVGKTTTIAKLAAHFSLMERKRIALLTIDTYRIAAVDQLKTYAEIIGIPIEVVFNPHELLVSLEKNKDKDLILIDTAGSNPFDSVRMEDLKNFLGQHFNIETHLLVSLTTKSRAMREIFSCYNIMRIHKVIFTKVDEATSFGNILNFSMHINRPISYITTGQNVPDDIEVADAYSLARLIVKGKEKEELAGETRYVNGSQGPGA